MTTRADIDLLQVEMDLLWASGGPELVVVCARDGVCARVGNNVPKQLARKLVAEVEATNPHSGLGTPPPDLERWRTELRDALGAAVSLAPESGPSYLIQPDVEFRSSASLIRSDAPDVVHLHRANPGNWGAEAWLDLLDGRLGPWVMAMHADRVISICHTPVSNVRAAEAGVWTHPEFRGHGHAAATTAEWARLMRPSGRRLFYSSSRRNHSSQAVAARLGLRQIGWLWQLRRGAAESGRTDPQR